MYLYIFIDTEKEIEFVIKLKPILKQQFIENMRNIKEINIKNQTCYFFNDVILIPTYCKETKIHTKNDIITWDILQSKVLMITKPFIV